MERRFKFSIGEYYHVYNRGVEKRDIFLDTSDKTRFQKLLFVSNGIRPVVFREIKNKSFGQINKDKSLVSIGAYCLMPNHFHFLIRETEDRGISNFMEKITTAYSKYFNKKYERTGTLFQGRFRAEHVDRDEYLKYLFAYIHLNPVKLIEPKWREKGIKNMKRVENYLKNFVYSSYLDYCGSNREEKLILASKEFPKYFTTVSSFEQDIEDWLKFSERNSNTKDHLRYT